MTDYTDLKRYEPDNPLDNAPSMREVADGDWVRYSDAADAIAALQEVLSFYASESLWDHDGGLDGLTPMDRDSGQKARSLLYGRIMAARQAEVDRLRTGYRVELGNPPANHPDHDGSSGF